MKPHTRITAAILTGTSLMLGGSVALAHNAAHIHLPTGECRDVGGGKPAPNEHADQDPGESDPYGARHGADQGNTPIYPRFCDELPPNHTH